MATSDESKADEVFLGAKDAEVVKPKFTEKAWESGEGGGQDAGESPSDNYAPNPRR